jgi:hypothetical protein
MRIAGILWLSSLCCLAQLQQTLPSHPDPPAPNSPAKDGGVREVLESIVIPPIPDAPFTATLATEWARFTADGATITLVNERHLARDARGRIYEERWALVPKFGSPPVPSKLTWIQIADPKLRTLYNCNTDKHVCDLLPYDSADDLSAASPRRPPTGASGTLTRGPMTWEDLGARNIAGVDTLGMRETRVIAVGAIGNDQPLSSMSEYWHSDHLGLNLLSIRSGPTFGKQTFTITELTPAEPDPQLFELPAGYRVNDQRKNPPISQ